MIHDSLGDRQKGYEEATGRTLIRRMPVVIRVDGKAFHSYLRKLPQQNDPYLKYHFDAKFRQLMTSVAQELVKGIQGARFAYVQSDEISILVRDWDTFETEPWFDNDVFKIISVSAAMAASYFNFFWQRLVGPQEIITDVALFDSRAFNVPKDDIDNHFIWRQKDAIRNSVNYIARKFFSQKQLDGLSIVDVKQKLLKDGNVRWETYPIWEQRGSCVYYKEIAHTQVLVVDDEPPLFTEDRTFITRHLEVPTFNDNVRIQ